MFYFPFHLRSFLYEFQKFEMGNNLVNLGHKQISKSIFELSKA